MTNNEIKDRLTKIICLLKIPGIGRGRFQKLVKVFGTPEKVLKTSVSQLDTIPGINRKIASDIKNKADFEDAHKISAQIIQLGWTVLFDDHPEYPDLLKNIPDKPAILFRLGNPTNQDKVIGIVGTRHATEKGKQIAYNLAKKLAIDGITVVSGLAEGIDAKAHWGALDANGKTIAVLGNALDIVYPSSNRNLYDIIKKQGTLYSEYLPGDGPHRAYFPGRSRIIAGISAGVVVVEAGQKSGALITAAHALEQGRELFSVPGSPNDKSVIGTNRLIKEGARLLTDVDDIYETLPSLKGEIKVKKYIQESDITETERKILDIFDSEPVQIDQISRSIQKPVEEILEFLLALELKGIIKEVSGKRFILTE